MIEVKRMRVSIPGNVRKGYEHLNVNSHHRCKGKWKKNKWYDYYKRYPHKEKTIKIIRSG